MKNLAKPLEWKENASDKTQLAYIHDFSAMYLAYEDKRNVPYFTAQFEIEESVIWQRTGLNTFDEAKAACQQHYDESLWDNLSEDARAILEQHLNG